MKTATDSGEYDEFVVFERALDFFSSFRGKQYRENQKSALKDLYDSDRSIRLLNAPPGSGKSLIGMALGYASGGVTYLCSSKSLQDQLEEEFPEAEKIRGRSNYRCLLNWGLTAAECIPGAKQYCKHYSECLYRLQKEKVERASLKILNYHYYLNETNYVGKFSGSKLVICDEADVLETILVNFIKLRISTEAVRRYKLGAPRFKTSQAKGAVDAWKAWAAAAAKTMTNHRNDISSNLGNAHQTLQQGPNVSVNESIRVLTSSLSSVNSIIFGLKNLLKYLDDTWLWERSERFWEFKPTWLTENLSRDFFFNSAERHVLMSGTQPPLEITSKLFGINPGEFHYFEVDSPFDIDNRKIVLKPSYSLTKETEASEIGAVKSAIKDVMDRQLGEKGIIHAISYRLAEQIMEINSNRLLLHESEQKQDIMEMFLDSDLPLVLVSPTIMRGVNLYDDRCRFIIWAKAPFLYLGDNTVRARAFSGQWGNLWYKSETAQALVQGAGRGVRHENDWCTTYILDGKAVELIQKNPKLFPVWFRDAMIFD